MDNISNNLALGASLRPIGDSSIGSQVGGTTSFDGASRSRSLEAWVSAPSTDTLITIDPPASYRSMTPQQLADEVLSHLQ